MPFGACIEPMNDANFGARVPWQVCEEVTDATQRVPAMGGNIRSTEPAKRRRSFLLW